jgi:hypothetical protein
VKSARVMSVRSMESSSIVLSAICSPSIKSEPLSHLIAPRVRALPVVIVRPAEVITPVVVSLASFLRKLSGRRLSPMVVEATTLPSLLVERIESVMFVIANDVVVALVVVALPVMVRLPAIVDEAEFAMKPPNVARPVVSKVEAPISMLPKPEVIDPEFRAPVVTKLESVSIAVSSVVSVVASIASMLLREAVSPPENIFVDPSVMSPPETTKSSVVVAPPETVSPVIVVPPPMVVEALEIRPASKSIKVDVALPRASGVQANTDVE